ncbi:MAG: NAD(P)/FAD-dependent oxidoreductase, partial [Myxococcota bacterium]|nr:NAD(P)/FAD-dependent oxidoreductase [Myxococcota bacterium]
MQMETPEDTEVLILGGGAAGLMCAYRLGELGIPAIVVEKNREVGRKILISGGGRCNFTNREVGFENFRSHNPHYARSALARYTSGDFIDLVNQRGIDWYEKTLGQLFCRRSAREIVELLRDGVLANGSEIRTGVEVLELAQHDAGGFLVKTSQGPLRARRVVVATGG